MISAVAWFIGLWCFGSLCFGLGCWWGGGPREEDFELAEALHELHGRLPPTVSAEDALALRSAAYRLCGGRGGSWSAAKRLT